MRTRSFDHSGNQMITEILGGVHEFFQINSLYNQNILETHAPIQTWTGVPWQSEDCRSGVGTKGFRNGESLRGPQAGSLGRSQVGSQVSGAEGQLSLLPQELPQKRRRPWEVTKSSVHM